MIMVIYLLTAFLLGKFRELPRAADAGRPGHGVPVRQHDQLPRLPRQRDHPDARVHSRDGWSYGCRLDPVSPPGHSHRYAGCGLGHPHHADVAGGVHRGFHHGRAQLHHHNPPGAYPGDDPDAHAAVHLGHRHGHGPRPACLPGTVRERHHDDPRQCARHEFLHAGDQVRLRSRTPTSTPAAVRSCSSTCSGSSATPRSTSWRCPRSASSPT